MNTAEILRAAAQRVRQSWTQGDYYNRETDGVCAVGAVCLVVGADLSSGRAVIDVTDGEAVKTLARFVGWTEDEYIHYWNDGKDMTADTVALAMECAADLWEQEQATSIDARLTAVETGKAVGSA